MWVERPDAINDADRIADALADAFNSADKINTAHKITDLLSNPSDNIV